MRLHIKPSIGTKKLARLTADDARRLYRQKKCQGLAASSVKRIHVILNQALRYAVRSKYIHANPLDDVKLPTAKPRNMDVLTLEQVEHLLSAAYGDRLESVYVFGCVVRLDGW